MPHVQQTFSIVFVLALMLLAWAIMIRRRRLARRRSTSSGTIPNSPSSGVFPAIADNGSASSPFAHAYGTEPPASDTLSFGSAIYDQPTQLLSVADCRSANRAMHVAKQRHPTWYGQPHRLAVTKKETDLWSMGSGGASYKGKSFAVQLGASGKKGGPNHQQASSRGSTRYRYGAKKRQLS